MNSNLPPQLIKILCWGRLIYFQNDVFHCLLCDIVVLMATCLVSGSVSQAGFVAGNRCVMDVTLKTARLPKGKRLAGISAACLTGAD